MKRFLDINKASEDFYNKDIKQKWRLNYHFEAPFGLINDPNGLSYYNGEYHLFFQWNPIGVEHKNKCWGLVKTKDFINYTIPKLVLTPTDFFDKDGVYSGSALEVDGKLKLMYTGNVKNEDGIRTPYQCVAECDKDGNVKKEGSIIDSVPEGYTPHFRDPKLFEKDGIYYFVIGAQTEKLKGATLLYSSKDFKEWKLEGEIKTEYEDFGYMWECPGLFEIDNKDVFIFSPQGLEKEEFKYQNIYQSGYIVGKLDYNTLEFKHNEFEELDYGSEFYAPQVFKDEKGRNILIGWMGLPEEEENHPVIKDGRIHALTMPRVLTLKDDILYQMPVEELKALRKDLIENVSNLETSSWRSSNIKENSYELELDINNKECEEVIIRMAYSNDEEVTLSFDFKNNIGIYKNNLKEGWQPERKFKIDNMDNNINLRLFMDTSACEIYINEGRYVLSNRIYPQDGSIGFEILSKKGNMLIENLKVWNLGGFNYVK